MVGLCNFHVCYEISILYLFYKVYFWSTPQMAIFTAFCQLEWLWPETSQLVRLHRHLSHQKRKHCWELLITITLQLHNPGLVTALREGQFAFLTKPSMSIMLWIGLSPYDWRRNSESYSGVAKGTHEWVVWCYVPIKEVWDPTSRSQL